MLFCYLLSLLFFVGRVFFLILIQYYENLKTCSKSREHCIMNPMYFNFNHLKILPLALSIFYLYVCILQEISDIVSFHRYSLNTYYSLNHMDIFLGKYNVIIPHSKINSLVSSSAQSILRFP